MKRTLFPLVAAGGFFLALTTAAALGAGSSPAVPLAPGGTSALQEPEEEPGKGALRHAAALAEEFGVSQDEVVQLHKDGLGFGAMFKIYQLARATGQSPAALIAGSPQVNGKPEPNFGELFAGLTGEQRQSLEDGPKNFGQLVRAKAKKR